MWLEYVADAVMNFANQCQKYALFLMCAVQQVAARRPARDQGGLFLSTPNYCLNYWPSARPGGILDMSHVGFRCVKSAAQPTQPIADKK